jgi:hypothetical protein
MMTLEQPQAAPAVRPDAQRKRRSRERRRRGMISVRLDLREMERQHLVAKGLLAPDRVDDAVACREALHAWFDLIFC